MLQADITWTKHKQFKSGTDNEPIEFFSECLCNSTRFDLMLGFFSSSAIRTLCDGFATFLYNGGRMRLIINNILSEKDKSAVENGLQNNTITPFDLSDIEKLKSTLSRKDIHFFECLSWLIANKRIEIKIIAPKGKIGISHTKSGIFSDNTDVVGFNGSCNFSKTALIDNIESIDAFCSWDGKIMEAKIENIQNSFERIFSGEDQSVCYLDQTEIETSISSNFKFRDISELIDIEKELNNEEQDENLRPAVKKALTKAKRRLDQTIEKIRIEKEKPKFPYDEPREYQKKAFENWRANGQKGLFAMATGTGKTITSLNCLLEIYKRLGYYKALILVPTITLVDQWEKECRKFNFNSINKVYSKNSWQEDIANIQLRERLFSDNETSYIVISTYASFSKIKIFNELNSLSPKTLLIADEAHNMGSGSMLKLLPKIKYERRIGLSATPERQFDEEGNKKLFAFFGSSNGYTYEYSMEEAIYNKVLCRYYYYPHLVMLTTSEMNDYIELSAKIAKYFNPEKEKFSKTDKILTALLLKRKRIIHKAENKKEEFKKILEDYYSKKRNLKYTLIYVPEGNDPNDFYETDVYSDVEELEDDNETVHLIDLYSQIVKEQDKKITVCKFTAQTQNREEILRQFATGELDVLTSMKCLDEGIDVPRAELAIFCASTGNPRQFVQRRGRILRTHPDKSFALIHDLVVIPQIETDSPSYELERSMLKKELERVKNFSMLSENSSDTVKILLEIMNYYQLNLYQNN
ncbi:MAG: DEAD/DEAH box helicase family protein [Proteiniphilum sp.]|jgi:superfamily II DNA or RNA helicase|uniref:DEAD/DEAH box helicase family protein n=1 Tax=Proteiniphilum sp. TaxID=1926877 RepID=UPI002B1F00AB|nr:DEAD/DEAH box helicase family protein [Proteiniphilum sp.]MEA5126918.1 DEAD/DEAH box helicase family protein [Proteiniphilum sp.]